MKDAIRYLFTMEEAFFIKEHQFNVRALDAVKIAEEIAEMEDRLAMLHESLVAATKEMMVRRRRVRRG